MGTKLMGIGMNALLIGVMVAGSSCSTVPPSHAASPGRGFQKSTDTLVGDVVYCQIDPCRGRTVLLESGVGATELELSTGDRDAIYFTVTFTAQKPGEDDPVPHFKYYCVLGDYGGAEAEATLHGVKSNDAWQEQGGRDFNSLFSIEKGWLWVSSEPAGHAHTAGPEVDLGEYPIAGAAAPGSAEPLMLGVFDAAAQPRQQQAASQTRFEPINVGWSITTVIRSRRTRGGPNASEYVFWRAKKSLTDAKVFNLDEGGTAYINSESRNIEDPEVIAEKAQNEFPPTWRVHRATGTGLGNWYPQHITESVADENFIDHVEDTVAGFVDSKCEACD